MRSALAFVALLAVVSAAPCTDVMTNHFYTETGDFTLAWEINKDNGTIDLEYSLPGSAFIGFGVGESMLGADIVISWINTDGSIATGDYWSDEHAPPSKDTALGGTDNVVPLCGQRKNNRTSIRFRRPLAATDSKFDTAIDVGINNFIYSWLNGPPGAIGFHGDNNHGHIRVDLTRADGVPQTLFGDEESGLAARRLVNEATTGTLVTLQKGDAGAPGTNGWPFGSVASFADPEPSTGSPILLLSTLERNIINIQSDPRCSLAIHRPLAMNNGSDAMASPRTTLFGKLVKVPESQIKNVSATYFKKHPEASIWAGFKDFAWYFLDPIDVFFTGGVGTRHYIGYIDAEQYLSHKL